MSHTTQNPVATRPAQAAQAELIDIAQLDRLLAMAGPAVARDLIALLQGDLGAAQLGLMAALDPFDWQALRMQSHVVIGLAGTIGATQLQVAAQRLNDLCQTVPSATPSATTVVTQVVQVIKTVLPALANRAQQLGLHK